MRIAVSACLLGEPCRYDGASKPNEAVRGMATCHELVPVCPEVMGGLPTPRVAHEIAFCPAESSSFKKSLPERVSFRVVDALGNDNTAYFVRGAEAALERAQSANCEIAILKSKSPSCGSGLVYDGSFSGVLTEGWGIAARMFADAGIAVYDECEAERIFG